MLADSNIVIYSSQSQYGDLRRLFATGKPAVSIVTYLEVFGYSKLQPDDRAYFEEFFLAAPIYSISPAIADRAVQLRQARKIGLPDAVIAATSLIHNLMLLTRNVDDFKWISGLKMQNPISS